MGAVNSVTETSGIPPAALINPAGGVMNMQNSDAFLAPHFAEYTPKTLYKVKCPMYILPSSISLNPSPNNQTQYAISFQGKCEQTCSVRIFIYAKEHISDNEFTESIELLRYPGQKRRSAPHAVSLNVGDFHFDGWREDTGIVDVNEIPQQKVDYEHSWPVIIQMTLDPLLPGMVEQLLYFCSMSVVNGVPHIKLISQKSLLQNRGFYLHKMYGLGELTGNKKGGKECTVCMTNPRDTCVMPCRHVCCCADCANTLRLQSDKCPVCRKPMTDLVYLSINPQFMPATVDGEGKLNVEMM